MKHSFAQSTAAFTAGFISVLQSLLLAFPIGLYSQNSYALSAECTSDGSYSPLPAPTAGSSPSPSSCLNVTAVNTECSNYETAATNTRATTCSGSTDPNCFQNAMVNNWGGVGPYCDSYTMYTTAYNWDLSTAVLFTAAGTVCAAAVAVGTQCNNPIEAPVACPLFGGLDTACTLLGVGADGADIAGMITISNQAGSENVWANGWSNELSTQAGAVAAGSAGVAVDVGSSVIRRLATKAQTKLVQRMAKSTAEKAAQDVADAAGPNPLTLIMMGITAGTFLAAAGVKYAALATDIKQANCGCEMIETLALPSPTPTAGTVGSNLITGPGGPGSEGAGNAATGTFPGVGLMTPAQLAAGGGTAFPPPNMAAALAGSSIGQALANNPNGANIPAALDKLGTSLGAIAGKLQSGQSPGQIAAAAMPAGTPDGVGAHLNKLDQDMKNGDLKVGMPGSTMTGGGGGGGARSPSSMNSAINFGSRTTPSKPTGTMDFAKASATVEPSEGDIWHADWHGSIFQIVSSKIIKINKIPDRIQQLEWASPLNRALAGLSNKPTVQAPELGKRGVIIK